MDRTGQGRHPPPSLKCAVNSGKANPYHRLLRTSASRIATVGRYATSTGSGKKFRLISDQDLVSIQELLQQGIKQTWIAMQYGVRQSTISKIKHRHYQYVRRQSLNE